MKEKTDGSTLESSVMLKLILISKISDYNSSDDNDILGKFSQKNFWMNYTFLGGKGNTYGVSNC